MRTSCALPGPMWKHDFLLTTSFHQDFPDTREVMMPPVLKQASGFRSDLPLGGIRQLASGIDIAANLVDDRDGVVLLVPGGDAGAFGEQEELLPCGAFFGLGMGVMNSARRRESMMRCVG